MSQNYNVNKKTVIFSYVTQFFQYCVSILVLPFILAVVDSSTLGVWYVFLSVSGVAYLLDFGFSSSFSRNISYVFSGAKKLEKEGCIIEESDSEVDYKLLKSIVFTTKQTYLKIGIIMLIMLLTIGSVYIVYTTKGYEYIYVWLFFSLSVVINYYYSYVNVLVRGRGMIDLSNKQIILSKLIYVIVVALLLYLGFDIWALVFANFLSTFVARQYGLHYFWDEELKEKVNSKSLGRPEDLFPIVWYNAKRSGITSITLYAYSQANVLIGGLFLSLNEVAQLGLCMQLFSVIQTLSGVCINTYYPHICSLWVTNDLVQIRSLFLKSQMICYSIFIVSSSVLLFAGDAILEIMHSKTFLPPFGVLAIFVFFYFMENTHGKCAVLISTNNRLPFYKADIVACVITIIVMLLLLDFNMGLYSFPIAMCCGSLPYNSWKWPVVCFKMLKIN